MKIVHVSTTPAKSSRVETTIYRRCQTCNNRMKIFKHRIGLKVCSNCTQAINKMFLSHNIQLKDIQGWDAETKQQWITKIDQLGLYVQAKPRVSKIKTRKA